MAWEPTYPNIVGHGLVPAPLVCTVCGLELHQGEGYAWRCSEWLRVRTGGALGLPGRCHCPDRLGVEGWHASCFDRGECLKRWVESGRPRRPQPPIPPRVIAWLARRIYREAISLPTVQLELGVE